MTTSSFTFIYDEMHREFLHHLQDQFPYVGYTEWDFEDMGIPYDAELVKRHERESSRLEELLGLLSKNGTTVTSDYTLTVKDRVVEYSGKKGWMTDTIEYLSEM